MASSHGRIYAYTWHDIALIRLVLSTPLPSTALINVMKEWVRSSGVESPERRNKDQPTWIHVPWLMMNHRSNYHSKTRCKMLLPSWGCSLWRMTWTTGPDTEEALVPSHDPSFSSGACRAARSFPRHLQPSGHFPSWNHPLGGAYNNLNFGDQFVEDRNPE